MATPFGIVPGSIPTSPGGPDEIDAQLGPNVTFVESKDLASIRLDDTGGPVKGLNNGPTSNGASAASGLTAAAAAAAAGGAANQTLARQMARFYTAKRLRPTDFSYEEAREEFLELQYTPITAVRPVDLATPVRIRRFGRPITVFVCITAYNESAEALKASLTGVADNLHALNLKSGIPWEEIAVCIVVDGRREANDEFLDYCKEDLKIYDPDLLQTEINDDMTIVHLFERTVEIPRHKAQHEYFDPLQLMLAVKEVNGGKVNSHLWFFMGFCRQIQPKYTILLDVGTAPTKNALASLIATMEYNPQIGGCCGEIAVSKPQWWNILQSAQVFEYKMNHVMDKSTESVFGFINVLPGAFSAYRYVAIRDEPLTAYFKTEEHEITELGPFMANMYLAEDRVLSFSVVAKQNRNWTCTYDADAVAYTDVPLSLLELLHQRRRWLNGSFFSLLYYVKHFSNFATHANHSIARVAFMSVQFAYQLLLLFMNWTSIGSMYLIQVIVIGAAMNSLGLGSGLLYIFTITYTFLTAAQVVVGLGSDARDMTYVYFVCAVLYGILMALMMASGAYLIVAGRLASFMSATGFISIAGYAICSLLHGEVIPMLITFIQYLLCLPMFVNMLQIYSMCNLNDVSWGTKEGRVQYQKASRFRAAPAPAPAPADPVNGSAKGSKLSILRDAARGVGKTAVAGNEARRLSLLDAVVDATNIGHAKHTDKAAHLVVATVRAGPVREGVKAVLDLIDDEVTRARKEFKSEQIAMQAIKRQFSAFRTRILGFWLVSNFIYISGVLYFGAAAWYALAFTILVAFVLAVRILGSVVYLGERVWKAMWHKLRRCCGRCCECCNQYEDDSDDEDEEGFEEPPNCWATCFGCACRRRKRRAVPQSDEVPDGDAAAAEEGKAGTDPAAGAAGGAAAPNGSTPAVGTDGAAAPAVEERRASVSSKQQKRKKNKPKRTTSNVGSMWADPWGGMPIAIQPQTAPMWHPSMAQMGSYAMPTQQYMVQPQMYWAQPGVGMQMNMGMDPNQPGVPMDQHTDMGSPLESKAQPESIDDPAYGSQDMEVVEEVTHVRREQLVDLGAAIDDADKISATLAAGSMRRVSQASAAPTKPKL